MDIALDDFKFTDGACEKGTYNPLYLMEQILLKYES